MLPFTVRVPGKYCVIILPISCYCRNIIRLSLLSIIVKIWYQTINFLKHVKKKNKKNCTTNVTHVKKMLRLNIKVKTLTCGLSIKTEQKKNNF